MTTPIKHQVEPNTPEWLELRKNYRTASEAAIVMGISPFTNPAKFKLIKAGLATQFYSKAMQQGHELEHKSREWANAMFAKEFKEEIWTNGQYLASLDGRSSDGVVLEIKTSSHTYNKIKEGEIPEYYAAQMQQQMYCSGSHVAYLVAYCPKTDQFACSEALTFNYTYMKLIEGAWIEFDNMPVPDGPVDASDNQDLLQAFMHYQELKRQRDDLDTRMEEAREAIMQHKAPDRATTCQGYEIVFKKGATKTDYKRAAADAKLDLAPYVSQGEPSYMLKMAPSIFSVENDE